MTGDGKRPIAAFVAAVLAAALLAACGGGSSSDSSSTTSAEPSSPTTTDATAQSGGQQNNSADKSNSPGQNRGQTQSGARKDQPQDQPNSSAQGNKDVETPLKVSGGGSAQFQTKGGDNSIQEFGEESDESELQEAAEVVHGFYVSRAEAKWDKACSYLAKANIEQLEQLAAQAPQSQEVGCATILKGFTRPLPESVEREITTVDAGSLRREGEEGFLIYYGPGHVKYAMPLREEGGAWKVTALSGTTLG